MYRVTGRWISNAAYETITNYLMSNLSMNGVTGYYQVLTLSTLRGTSQFVTHDHCFLNFGSGTTSLQQKLCSI